MNRRTVSFPAPGGLTLAGDLYARDETAGEGIIYCHGMFSSRKGYKISRLAEPLAGAGYTVLAFDFSCSVDGPLTPGELSLEREVADIGAAAGYLHASGYSRVHCVGSSLGGLAALLYASRRPPGLVSLATIAAPADGSFVAGLLAPRDPGTLPADGYVQLEGYRVRNGFFRELALLDPRRYLPRIRIPVLSFHGEFDEVVPKGNLRIIDDLVTGKTEQVLIQGGDHALTGDGALSEITGRLLAWLGSR